MSAHEGDEHPNTRSSLHWTACTSRSRESQCLLFTRLSWCLLHNWNVHHSVVTAILHSFLNHLIHQHLSLQRDSAMC